MRPALRNATVTGFVLAAALFATALAQAPSLVLADGTTCLAAAPGTNVSVAGAPVGHFCLRGVVLQDDLRLQDGTASVTRVTFDPADPKTVFEVTPLELEVSSVWLAGGGVCYWAGYGATLAFGGERVNYTCQGDDVLLGDLEQVGGEVYAHKGTVGHDDEGFTLSDEARVRVTRLDATSPLVGVRWQLVSFGEGQDEPAAQARPTLEVEAGMAYGTTGCNRWFSPVEFGLGGAVSFTTPGSTMMYCEGLMEQEQRFLAALSAVSGYRLEAEGRLVLFGGEGELVFSDR